MKRSKEVILWAFFLAVCFWAGYLKGFLPLTFKHSLFVKGTARIYNACPFDFPRPFITALEEELGQKVEVIKIRSWDELEAKMVTKVGAHLLFAPAHWASDLSREGVIVGLSYLQPKIDKYIAADFNSGSQVLPLFWTVTQFITAAESFADQDLNSIARSKSLNEIHLFPDADLIATHLKDWPVQLKDIEAFSFRNPPDQFHANALWEVPHLVNVPGQRVIETNRARALISYGFMIPKNSGNRRVSYRVLDILLENVMQKSLLAAWPLATTLKDETNQLDLPREKRAELLRELKLNELIILQHRYLSEFRDFQTKYNIVF